MKIRLSSWMLIPLLLAAGCSSPKPALQPTPATFAGNAMIIDDFESASTAWVPGMWPMVGDSSATRAALSTQHPTRGRQSLQLQFNGDRQKAIFTLDRPLHLSDAQTLAFDLYNDDGAAQAVGIAFRSGPERRWQESAPEPVKPGPNAVQFDLTQATYKSAQTNWQYSVTLQSMNDVQSLAVVVYPAKAGSVYIDKLLATRAVQPLPPGAAAKIDSTTPYINLNTRTPAIGQYSRLELDIGTNVQADNPFDPAQIAIDVHFRSPQGDVTTVPAFFTQDFDPKTSRPIWPQQWQARFTPALEGTWTADATLKTPAVSLTSQPVTFTVEPAVARGFVRVNTDNHRYLAFDSGEAYFPVGINLGWGHDEPLKDYARWFDQLQKNGANVARIWMASWSFGIEWSDSGLGRYRLDRAWQLDQVMWMAEQRGIYIILVLINHGAFNTTVNPEWDRNPYNAQLGGPCRTPADFATNPQAIKLFEQRLRYIAARWSYSPNLLAWEWWNEVNFTPLADPNLLRPWLQTMTAYLRRVDPYHHLTSISYSDVNDPRITALPEIDLMQRHSYNSLDPWISMPKAYAELSGYGLVKPDKPILFTEFGASAQGEEPTPFDTEGVHFHNGLWASTFSGFASAAMYWWWDSYIEPNNYWYHLKGLAGFLADQDIAGLTPAPVQIFTSTAQATALERKDRALLWLRSSQYSVESAVSAFRNATLFGGASKTGWRYELQPRRNITVTLAGMQNGNYRVSWYDTRTADMLRSDTARAGDGNLVLAAPPFDRDLAAKIIRLSP